MKSLDDAIDKIYSEISKTGIITDNQLLFLILNKPKKDTINDLINYGNKIISIINKNLKEW